MDRAIDRLETEYVPYPYQFYNAGVLREGLIAAVVRGTSGPPDRSGGMGGSAIPSSLFFDDLFNQGDDRMGALLLVGEG